MGNSTLLIPRSSGRIPELDGIRGMAIGLVLVCHYFVDLTPAGYHWFAQLAWSGVDLFFVLSGFLIAGILLDKKHSPSYYKTFYLRRFNRIIPLYAIWLGIFAIGALSVDPSRPGPLQQTFSTAIPFWTYFLFLQNFAMSVRNTFGATSMSITWSLAVEEQFYLLLPLLIQRLSRKGLCRFIVFSILFAPVLRTIFHLLGANTFVTYTLLPCRADSLGFGVLAALAYRNPAIWSWVASHRRYIYAAFSLLGFGAALWTLRPFPLMERIGYTWMGAFYVCLLLLVLASPGPVERLIFGNSRLVRLGTIAYGVYLMHRGVLWVCQVVFFQREPYIHDSATMLVTGLSLCITLALAELSWRYLEKPLIRRAHARHDYAESQREVVPVCA